MSAPQESHRHLLLRVARRALTAQGFEPDFSAEALAEVGRDTPAARGNDRAIQDRRALPWCSIDNDESRDLDQLTVATTVGASSHVLVAVADVTERVVADSDMDRHARTNTTSIYTPPQVFPMLPDQLSTDLTSLNAGDDRLAIVVEMAVDAEGRVGTAQVFRAWVHNHARLSYSGVGPWLEGAGAMPEDIGRVRGLAENLRRQDVLATQMRAYRYENGALDLETLDARARLDGDRVSTLASDRPNRAKQLIADFMIAANGANARFLESRGFPVVRRVVRSPERWERIVAIARASSDTLPDAPDSRELGAFLARRRAADPLRFPDLSLAVIKLMGRGQYAASQPGEQETGHFGLAVSDYAHSTAPNRRYADLITQRLLKAALAGQPVPYSREQLDALAARCTARSDAAQKVERLVQKAAAACLLVDRIGEEFEGIVTGASDKGTWVRVFNPPVEGRVERGAQGFDVGDRVRVRLIGAEPEQGFIDFAGLQDLGGGRA